MNKYYYKVIIPFVDGLIRRKAIKDKDGYYLDFDHLSGLERSVFAMHLLKYDETLESLYIGDNKDQNYENSFSEILTQMLYLDDIESKLNFANQVKKNIVSFYKNSINELIEKRIAIVESEDNSNNGLTSYQLDSTREIIWI